MLNNLIVVTGDHGYGYNSYYLARKNEELSFPSDVSIASYFDAINYEVKDVNFSVDMTVRGTLVDVSETSTGYLTKVTKHIPVMDEVISDEVGVEENDTVSYTLENIPVAGKLENYLRGTIYDGVTAIQTFTVPRGSTTVNISSSTNASPISVTANNHGYATGDTVIITGHTTNTNANGTWEITVTGSNTFTLNGSTGNGTGGASGTVRNRNGALVIEKIGSEQPTVRATSGVIDEEDNKIVLTWNQDPGASSVVVDYEYESSETTSVLSKVAPVADQYDNVSVHGSVSIKTKYIKIMTNFKCKTKTGYTYTEGRVFYTRCKYKNNSCSSNSNAIVPAITVCNQRLF